MPHGYAEDPTLDGRVQEALHIAHAFGRAADFDLVHSHLDWLPLAFEQLCPAPLVTTVHGLGAASILPAYRASRSALVSISDRGGDAGAATAAVDLAVRLDRSAVRRHAVDRFGADRMVSDYLALYEKILDGYEVPAASPVPPAD